MLPRKNRLQRPDFTLLASGKRFSTEHFSCTQKDSDTLKVAIVVSKKTAKKSPDRHLLKRRVSAVLEQNPPPPGLYNIFARKGSQLLSYQEIKTEISTLLRLPHSV